MDTTDRFARLAETPFKTTDAQGLSLPVRGGKFREIYDPSGPARLEYALYWREDNDNPALQRFFKLLEERYPG